MAKKRKRWGGDRSAKSHGRELPPSSSPPTPSVSKQNAARVGRLKTLNLVIFGASGVSLLYLRSRLDWSLLERLPRPVLVLFTVLTMVGFVLHELLIRATRKLESEPDADVKRWSQLLIWQLVFTVAIITLLLSPFLYILGYTDRVAGLISTWFPKVQARVAKLYAWVTTFATSNVIGWILQELFTGLVTSKLKSLYRAWRKGSREQRRNRVPRGDGRKRGT